MMILNRIPVFTASLVCAICLSCMLRDCSGLKDFFVMESNWADSTGGNIGGKAYITFEEYRPTCGWKIILTCSTEIEYVGIWNVQFFGSPDNYTFIFGNETNEPDLTGYSVKPHDILVHTFGDPKNDFVNVTWYCVCDHYTAGTCKMVSGSAATLGPWRIHLSEQEGQCYTGSMLKPLNKIRNLVECGSECVRLPACSGVNFRSSTNNCDLVLEYTGSNPSLLGTVSGCTFWKVEWKL